MGLDCGGSCSRVMAVNNEGAIVFQGQSGAANLVSTPDARLKRNLLHASQGCPGATYVCGCFAGLVGDETRERGEELLRLFFPGACVRAEPDYTAAFYSSPPDTDICVISGTGSLVCSRGEFSMVKSGGRGYILGDYGSGFHYGRDALTHFLDNPKTCTARLRQAIVELFGTDHEGLIITAVYKSGTAPQILGKLAKVLGMEALAGEPYALDSVDRNGRALVDVVTGHVNRYFPRANSLNLSLAGGVWKAAPIFRDRFQELMAKQFPKMRITVTRIHKPPLYGAVELAKELSVGN